MFQVWICIGRPARKYIEFDVVCLRGHWTLEITLLGLVHGGGVPAVLGGVSVVDTYIYVHIGKTLRLTPRNCPFNLHQGGISSPFQSQHFPLSSCPNFSTTLHSLSAVNSALNNFSFGVVAQKFSLNPVFTVPGCRATLMAFSPAVFLRYMSKLLASWFTPALLAR